jgi:hypothetical protein
VVSDEVDCADCSIFLADLTALREKHASKCEELDMLRVELAKLQSRPTLLGACTSCPGLLLTDKRRIHLRSASVRTYTFFATGFPRFWSIREARGLQAFDLPLLTTTQTLTTVKLEND